MVRWGTDHLVVVARRPPGTDSMGNLHSFLSQDDAVKAVHQETLVMPIARVETMNWRVVGSIAITKRDVHSSDRYFYYPYWHGVAELQGKPDDSTNAMIKMSL